MELFEVDAEPRDEAPMPEKVIIVGAGENGRVIAEILRRKYVVTGFLDDTASAPEIVGTVTDFHRFARNHAFFVSVGGNARRKAIYETMKAAEVRFVNAVHATAVVERSAIVGPNVFIGALSYVNIGSRIGENVFINNGCIIEHDNTIGAHSHVAPGVITGGGVRIGELNFIALGARINDHLALGDCVIIGSGAVVIDDIPPDSTAVGIPAKVIKHAPAATA